MDRCGGKKGDRQFTSKQEIDEVVRRQTTLNSHQQPHIPPHQRSASLGLRLQGKRIKIGRRLRAVP
ncbi:MAG: hypothetical protein WBA57_24145 [Elainellaceae cyanobacterium]